MNKKILIFSFLSIVIFCFSELNAMTDMTAEELSDQCTLPLNFTFSNASGKTIWVALYNNKKIIYESQLHDISSILYSPSFEIGLKNQEQITIAIWDNNPGEIKLVSSWLGLRKSLSPTPNVTHTFNVPNNKKMTIIFKNNSFEHKENFISKEQQ